jgi:nucleoside-diphosphate-sugar epimerase
MGQVHVLPELIKKARMLPKGGCLEVASVDHRRAFCFIDDAVEILRRLASEPQAANGTFNLGNQDQEVSIGEVANVVLSTIGRTDLNIVVLPPTPGSPARRCPDMNRTINFTGFRPKVNLEEGARRTYKWYADNVFLDGGVSAI